MNPREIKCFTCPLRSFLPPFPSSSLAFVDGTSDRRSGVKWLRKSCGDCRFKTLKDGHHFRLKIIIEDHSAQTFNVLYFQGQTNNIFSLSLCFSHKSKMSGWPPPGPGPWAGLQGPPYSWDSMNSNREGRDPLTKYVASPLLEVSTEIKYIYSRLG